MKKDLFIYAALCALVAAGCSKQDEAETLQPEQGKALNITINATRHEAPSTRTEYEDGTDKLIVKWKSNKTDKLGVFTTGNDATTTTNAEFSVDGDLSTDGKTAHFTGSLTISDPAQDATVYGYYPYSNTAGITPAAIPIDLSSQKQTSNIGLDHLAAKDYMAATPVTKTFSNGEQNLSLEFNPLLAIISFKITKKMTVESIKLEAVGESNKTPFYTNGTVDITTADKTFPITGGGTAQSSVELSVTNGTISSGTGMFHMMIFPIAASAMPAEFKVTVTTTTGIAYTQTMNAPTQGFERGKRYITTLDGLTKDDTPDVWDGTLPTADDAYTYSGGEGSASKPYRISTAKDLAQLAANVNAGYDSDKYFSLTKNIELNEKEWTPIGIYAGDLDTFKGTFDGNGYSVTGLSINSNQQFLGLFGYIEKGTVKNLNVTGNITSSFYANGCVGGIAGYTYDSYIIGCSYSGSVTSTNYNTKTGGICGSVSGYVIGCYNTSTVKSTYTNSADCGGIAGSTNSRNDGIIGCYNTGAVTGTENTTVGGIVATNQAKVRGCYNTGIVTGVTICGGILGSNSIDAIGCLWVKSDAANTATVGIATGTGAGTIDPIADIANLNESISTLNNGIDEWNKDYTSDLKKYCHFKFKADSDGTTPPTLTTEP